MLKKTKSTTELALLIFVISSFIIAIGVYGIVEIRTLKNNSKELYADRILPIEQLGDVRYFATSLLTTVHQLENNQLSFEEAQPIIHQASDSISHNWQKYLKTAFTAKEKKLEKATSKLVNQTQNTIVKLEIILINKDRVVLKKLLSNDFDVQLNNLIVYTNELLDMQVKIGKSIYLGNVEIYNSSSKKIYLLFLIVFVLAIPFTYYLIKKNGALEKKFGLNRNKLEVTEQNYRNLIEYAGDAILILDEDTKIIDLNDKATELLGFSRAELLKMEIKGLIAKEEIAQQELDIEGVKKSKIAIIYREFVRKDGSRVHVEIGNRLTDGKGFFAIVRDITERKKSEIAIKESEEKYRYLFNNNPTHIIIWDLETLKILEVNETVVNNYGYSQEEWSNMTVLDYRKQEEHQKIKDFGLYMLNSNEPIALSNWKHIKKNGEEMLMEIASHKIIYKNQAAILSLANDITEKIKVLTELAEKEAQLHLFIEHSPASIAMLDDKLQYLARSNRWMIDYNLVGQEIIGKSHYEVFPEIGENWKEVHQRCLNGAIEKCEEEAFVRADGSIEWLRWEIHPWKKGDGEIGGIIILSEVITERKRATEMFKNQFENSPDIILYVNKNYIIEAINRGNQFGETKEDFIGQNCLTVLPPESREASKEALDHCFQNNERLEVENALKHNRWVRSRFVPVVTNGEVTHVMIFGTDFTERKQAEIKLLQSEEKYRALTENVSDGIALMDTEFKVAYLSPSAQKITGYSFEDLMLVPVIEFVHPDEFEEALQFFLIVFTSPNVPLQNQFRVLHKDGHYIWLEGTALNLLNDENIKSLILNFRDITERKKSEEQLALTASIVESSNDAIISKTIEGVITTWNSGAEKILGYKAEEVLGNNISVIIPEWILEEEKEILSKVRKGIAIFHHETQRLKKNGEVIYVSLTISPILDVLGNVTGASKIMRDITEKKKIENELLRYNEELMKANSELDRFVYSASHDLRAPLKSILGLINIAKMDIQSSALATESKSLMDIMNMLNKSATKLDGFIEDILNYSRNERLELAYNTIDFDKLVNEVKSSFRFAEGMVDVDLNVTINTENDFVSDGKRLAIVLNNLITNAYKYSDANKEKSIVDITFNSVDDAIQIVVKDNGIGIATDEIDKIFNMFHRSTSLSSGSGLGLYIVKETLEKLGGKISVESELHVGTTFIVEIPNLVHT
ncbi:PAS domain S-box protein [Flavobacterium sp. SUN046]|uniref:PAS domain S-box protein n=1 Tax=Flavobacterium sp. SUN046 TaxID=3002440 RepID=UPI002DB8817B|nr:PAS domain S-box protein [Flavobacterium sp. SUN046]MEC4050317.1 PAS domain S-box protein [Flavobacterium sp. SUN046]